MRMAADTASDRSIPGDVREVVILVDPPTTSKWAALTKSSHDTALPDGLHGASRARSNDFRFVD
jgi:hypothetical protein